MKGNAYVETGGKEEKLEINEVKCVGPLCVCVCVCVCGHTMRGLGC